MDRPFGGSSKADAAGAILIAGPTASGKSALALELAERTGGVVINADSMQLYRDLRLVTARPDADEEARASHRLYGVIDAAEAFSTGAWLARMSDELQLARRDGMRPIIVGGTGLYFRALTQGFAEVPEVPDAVRSACRTLAETGGVEAVRAALVPHDPEAAGRLADLQRLTRALEVVLSSGRSLASWQAERPGEPLLLPSAARMVVLAPTRPWLHARIVRRAGLMMGSEGQGEVAALLARGLPDSLPAMRAIGIREIGGWMAGHLSKSDALQQLVVATRQYAKRQETFFRGQLSEWRRADPANASELDEIIQYFISS